MDTKEHYKPIHLLLICLSILIMHQRFTFGSMSRGDHTKTLCITKEREALLEFKRGLIDEYNLLSSWGNEEDNEECCSWRGVECSNTTGHILVLNLRIGTFESTPDGPKDIILTGKLYHGNGLVQWKNKESEYRNILWLLKTIDLSSNELVGDIPKDFSRMNALLSLNLSRNSLTGNIIEGIGLMKMLESLDLSGNHLAGKIPVGLANLTFLSVLDLSNNNLSGRIPSSTQLQGFDPSTYGGNIQLCGPPLPECPSFASPNPHVGYDSTCQENDDEFPSKEFYISMALGFIVSFWGILGSLFFNNSWRNAYFKWLNGCQNWLHVSSALCFARLKAKLRA